MTRFETVVKENSAGNGLLLINLTVSCVLDLAYSEALSKILSRGKQVLRSGLKKGLATGAYVICP